MGFEKKKKIEKKRRKKKKKQKKKTLHCMHLKKYVYVVDQVPPRSCNS